ncbi:cadmium transporter [Mycobacterium gordonae]|nr:cadmium resistance transporter [Mycobacterium gordonae]OBJ81405.1 cadmium transporter [Mycobacterium gordonae]
MQAVVASAAAAVGLFVGTTVDDVVVLAVLNVSSRAQGRPRQWQIWAGLYAGMAALVIVSLVAARGLTLVPEGWIWLLGLIPLLLGVRKLVTVIRARNSGETVSPAAATGLAGVMGLTIAGGGDSIAAFTPMFRTLGAGGVAFTLVVFAVCVAAWCAAGPWLVSHRKLTHVVEVWGRWIVPAAFILIGLYVCYEAGIVDVWDTKIAAALSRR